MPKRVVEPLTPTQVRKILSTPQADRKEYRDAPPTGVRRLFLRVEPWHGDAASATCWYEYRFQMKTRRLRIEPSTVMLADAREACRRAAAQIALGVDPSQPQRDRASALTVRELVARFRQEYVPCNQKKTTQRVNGGLRNNVGLRRVIPQNSVGGYRWKVPSIAMS